MDRIELLIDEAYQIFSETSVFDAIDLPTREEAAKWLAEFHGLSAGEEKIERYLSIIDRLRAEIED